MATNRTLIKMSPSDTKTLVSNSYTKTKVTFLVLVALSVIAVVILLISLLLDATSHSGIIFHALDTNSIEITSFGIAMVIITLLLIAADTVMGIVAICLRNYYQENVTIKLDANGHPLSTKKELYEELDRFRATKDLRRQMLKERYDAIRESNNLIESQIYYAEDQMKLMAKKRQVLEEWLRQKNLFNGISYILQQTTKYDRLPLAVNRREFKAIKGAINNYIDRLYASDIDHKVALASNDGKENVRSIAKLINNPLKFYQAIKDVGFEDNWVTKEYLSSLEEYLKKHHPELVDLAESEHFYDLMSVTDHPENIDKVKFDPSRWGAFSSINDQVEHFYEVVSNRQKKKLEQKYN